jgi:hypothetical protein
MGISNKFEYSLDYYSGAQSAVFFEDVLIDEVTSLQWTVQQSKIPIYGYASQTFDEMAKGTIIVQGSFSINFVEAGYLWSTLDRLSKRSAKTDLTRSSIENWAKGRESVGLIKDKNWVLKETAEAYNTWSDTLYERDQSQHDMKKWGLTSSTAITEHVNDLVWGPDSTTKAQSEDYTNNGRRIDKKELNGFDIYLKFRHTGSTSFTVHKIQDVHLLGKAQTVVIDENPVQEVYSFYAKNVI